eukprot:CAMPEP_0170639824 /NCGR_PEP_ID=MMETSP0224-20130122/39869_1 /TAXON_ID=285029 /ORGANISM="Togula jolla, Strain CCCM 725" /LENGTH=375 /DNA_ID=CAMNT_0010970233 /DNA_START=91 /DNA_END=1214 /DNA_ORIENTATION=+
MAASMPDGSSPLPDHLVGTCGFLGMSPKKYIHRFPVVELNFTFHDRTDESYDKRAELYGSLGLRTVIKVSGYATHTRVLRNPSEWLPWLREKYRPLMEAGIVLALLWQLPPSCECTDDMLIRLAELGELLQIPGSAWSSTRHVVEFRHASWYDNPSVAEILKHHNFIDARVHVVNDTGWSGDLESGWHGGRNAGADQGGASADFLYLRCFGSGSRGVGKYSTTELRAIATEASRASSAVVMFGQADVPTHALSNGLELQEILRSGELVTPTQRWLGLPPANEGEEEVVFSKPLQFVSGRVVEVNSHLDGRVLLNVGGRRGYLGSRHSAKRGLQLTVGTVLDDLCIEAESAGWLILSVHRDRNACEDAEGAVPPKA